jgi:thiosulfate/3-mercaptopyruvate sulfurtransferase
MPTMETNTLISTQALAALLGQPDLVIVDCRHDLANIAAGRADFAKAHIPGAQFLHLDEDLSAKMTGTNGRHPLPTPEAFSALMGRIGVGPSTRVIAYDAQGGMVASRLWWMLKLWAGHDAVSVLDGGWQAWTTDSRPVSAEVPAPKAAQFHFSARKHTVDAAWVLAHVGKPGMTLLDARAPDRYRGQNETMDPVGGRIPHARNRFFRENLAADGRFKPAAQLRAEYEAVLAGTRPDELVHQCGSGVSACHNILAMEVAGYAGTRLYPGSWSEWCADRTRPFASGEPGPAG